MPYKIKDKNGLFSHGIIQTSHWNDRKPFVKWSSKGKDWSNEKTVKDHLLKYIEKGGDISGWEVIEVVYSPTRPIQEWIDPKMLMKYLKVA